MPRAVRVTRLLLLSFRAFSLCLLLLLSRRINHERRVPRCDSLVPPSVSSPVAVTLLCLGDTFRNSCPPARSLAASTRPSKSSAMRCDAMRTTTMPFDDFRRRRFIYRTDSIVVPAPRLQTRNRDTSQHRIHRKPAPLSHQP